MSLGDNLVESKASPEHIHGKDVADLLLQDSHPAQKMQLAQNERGIPDISPSPVPVLSNELPTVVISGTGMAAPIVAAERALELQRK